MTNRLKALPKSKRNGLHAVAPAAPVAPPPPLKLNLGSGRMKMEGFLSVDAVKFETVDVVTDLTKRWPWGDATVDEAVSSHSLEHLEAMERVHFFNELYRVLKPGAKCTITVPHWSNTRAYGDPTHKWPPFTEMAGYYLLKAWREIQAPHTDSRNVPGMFSCDFDAVWGPTFNLDHPEMKGKSDEARSYAARNYRDVCIDLIVTVTKRAPA